MWHAGKKCTPEEIEVLRELEYDLFMCNPGFRSMWNDNFQEYFLALFDEEKWNAREEQQEKNISGNMGIKMVEDPEFHEFMKNQAIMEEVLSGDLKIENAPIQMQAELREMVEEMKYDEENFDEWMEEQEREENEDTLLQLAKEWSMDLCKASAELYEQTGNIDSFRISSNCLTVVGKIVGAGTTDYSELRENLYDFEWRIDLINYKLSLTSLRRCLESLENLNSNKEFSNRFDIQRFIDQGKKIQQELIDRLDTIEQSRFKKSIKTN